MMKWLVAQFADHVAHGLQLRRIDLEERVRIGELVDGHLAVVDTGGDVADLGTVVDLTTLVIEPRIGTGHGRTSVFSAGGMVGTRT